MIGKVIRGSDARRLLYYLYGPGKANEHTDPHLVAGFADPAGLEPAHRPGRGRDIRPLAELLAQPLAAVNGSNYRQPVWHCAVRAAPGDQELTDEQWARIAVHIMDRAGLAPRDDDLAVRWVAVRHAPDHIHLVATLARQDRIRPKVWNDYYRVREACRDAARRGGGHVHADGAGRAPGHRRPGSRAGRRGVGVLRPAARGGSPGAGTGQRGQPR
jgi:hypothetical protein